MTRHALCVGVSTYDDDAFQNLPQCRNDAMEVASLLASDRGGYATKTVIDPTSGELTEAIWKFLETSGSADELLLYFSGHGIRTFTRKLCLATRDTVESRFLPTSVKFDEVLEYLRELDKKTVLIVLDCCFSGSAEKSIMSKSGNDVVGEETKELLAERGWSVLASSGRFAASWAQDSDDLSEFTSAFLQVSGRLVEENSSWIKVATVYENLKFEPLRETPKLMGDNALFRVLKGTATPTASTPSQRPEPSIRQRACNSPFPQFLGLLVVEGFRAWVTTHPKGKGFAKSKQVFDDVFVLVNEDEVFSRKADQADAAIRKSNSLLTDLVDTVGQPIALVHPVSLPDVTFRRFMGSDRTYVLRDHAQLNTGSYPVMDRRRVFAISRVNSSWHAFPLPEDYSREAFGFTVAARASKEDKLIIIKEDTFRRNSKYLAIERSINRVGGFSTTGRSGEANYTELSEVEGARERLEQSVVSRQTKFKGLGGAVMVETPTQTQRREAEVPVACETCMDEKEVLAELNTRKYRVPCPDCSSKTNSTWRPLFTEKAKIQPSSVKSNADPRHLGGSPSKSASTMVDGHDDEQPKLGLDYINWLIEKMRDKPK